MGEDHVAPPTNEVALNTLVDPRDQALSHAATSGVPGDTTSGVAGGSAASYVQESLIASSVSFACRW